MLQYYYIKIFWIVVDQIITFTFSHSTIILYYYLLTTNHNNLLCIYFLLVNFHLIIY